jgi:hypothetical protein
MFSGKSRQNVEIGTAATLSHSQSLKLCRINSFMLGAQSVNPDFKVKIVWVNTGLIPAKEADAARFC